MISGDLNFQTGDKIKSKVNHSLVGKIVGVSYNSIERENEYYIVWDSNPGVQIPYSESIIGTMIEKQPDTYSYHVMYGYIDPDTDELVLSSGENPLPQPQGCLHKWKHYQGLVEEFDYCEKCDEKRK